MQYCAPAFAPAQLALRKTTEIIKMHACAHDGPPPPKFEFSPLVSSTMLTNMIVETVELMQISCEKSSVYPYNSAASYQGTEQQRPSFT